MPPTKQQIDNLASMVAEVGINTVVSIAVRSAAGYDLDKPIFGMIKGEIKHAVGAASSAANIIVRYENHNL